MKAYSKELIYYCKSESDGTFLLNQQTYHSVDQSFKDDFVDEVKDSVFSGLQYSPVKTSCSKRWL